MTVRPVVKQYTSTDHPRERSKEPWTKELPETGILQLIDSPDVLPAAAGEDGNCLE